MDPIKAQKVRAMNKKSSHQFFQSLILHSLLALACSLFCSYSYLFPNSFHTIKHLLFYSLPNTWSRFVNPSCLFLVVNFIVVFLIGESRISGKQYSSASSSSPVDQVYDEYVARIRRRRPSTTFEEIINKKEENKSVETMDGRPMEDNNANGIIEDRKEVDEVPKKEESSSDVHDEDFEECEESIENEKDEEDEEMEEKQVVVEEEEEESVGLAAEELNKRVEDFIARVNKQRWLEARFLVSSTRA